MNRFLQAITQPGINIIAEIKYSSPSHGPFLCQRPAPEIAKIYKENGAAAISVLTDRERFRGDIKYLKEVADTEDCLPLLRKDFIKTPEQVREARENGASAFLLIVRDLRPDLMRQLIDARSGRGPPPPGRSSQCVRAGDSDRAGGSGHRGEQPRPGHFQCRHQYVLQDRPVIGG